jgi:hypothetical protein
VHGQSPVWDAALQPPVIAETARESCFTQGKGAPVENSTRRITTRTVGAPNHCRCRCRKQRAHVRHASTRRPLLAVQRWQANARLVSSWSKLVSNGSLLLVALSLTCACMSAPVGEPTCGGLRASCLGTDVDEGRGPSAGHHKYYLAACTVFRDEDRFLREWLAFHLCVGVEHFFLYADRPFDDCYIEILQPYVDAGVATVTSAVPVRNPQIPTYDVCLEDHRHDARWLAFIDIDEFLHPANDSAILRDVLQDFHEFGGVVVPWTLMGSSHHTSAPPGLVIENYLHRRSLPECNGDTCAYKVLVQGQHTERCDVHNHYYYDDYFAVNEAGRRLHDDASLLPMESFPGDFPNAVLRLYHFKSKSLADALWKLGRKEGVNAEGNENLNPSTLQGQLTWFVNSDYNEVFDDSLLQYIPCVRRS